jgi:type VI secretion system secreted protein Hcp
MAHDMFLKITGLKGESADSKHKDEIDVLSWSWGASQSGTMHIATGGGAGKVNVQDMNLTKYVDASSPSLFGACASGKHFTEAVLVNRKAGENPLEYLTITMTDVLVTSYQTGGSGGEDKLTENVSLNFAKVKKEYKAQNADGSAGATGVHAWNIAQNKAE